MKDLEQVHLKEGARQVEIDKPTTGPGKVRTHLCFRGDTLVETLHGVVAMRDLPTTGMVRGPYGQFVGYGDAGLTIRDAEMVELRIGGHGSIHCTPWHQVLTRERGWVRADDSVGLTTVSCWPRGDGRVMRVRRAARADAYCLRVPRLACFALASGLVVSNSDGLGYYVEEQFGLVTPGRLVMTDIG